MFVKCSYVFFQTKVTWGSHRATNPPLTPRSGSSSLWFSVSISSRLYLFIPGLYLSGMILRFRFGLLHVAGRETTSLPKQRENSCVRYNVIIQSYQLWFYYKHFGKPSRPHSFSSISFEMFASDVASSTHGYFCLDAGFQTATKTIDCIKWILTRTRRRRSTKNEGFYYI